MIKKKGGKKKRHGIWVKLLVLYRPSPLFYSNSHPALLTGHHQTTPPSLFPLIQVEPIPPGNQALAAAISRANTSCLQEPPSPSPSSCLSPPLALLAEIFTETRNSLQLNPDLVQDVSPHAHQTITASEGAILSILCATVSGIVAITTQLDRVSTQLAEVHKRKSGTPRKPP